MPKINSAIENTQIAIFRGREIRKKIYQNEWWFSVVDIVGALTDSVDARDYWYKMKIRVKDDEDFEPSTICRQLKLKAPDGKMRETDCANTEGLFRIIQSIKQDVFVFAYPSKARLSPVVQPFQERAGLLLKAKLFQ